MYKKVTNTLLKIIPTINLYKMIQKIYRFTKNNKLLIFVETVKYFWIWCTFL